MRSARSPRSKAGATASSAPATPAPRSVADRLLGGAAEFPGADMSTKLKLLGVDVASFGDAMGATPDCLEVVVNDAVNQTYAKLVLSDDAKTLLGGILVGDASAYGVLRPMVGEQLPGDPLALIAPAGSEGGAAYWVSAPCPPTRRSAPATTSPRAIYRRHRRRLRDVPAEELHPGRHLVRLLRAAAQAAPRSRGRRAVQGAVRALQPVPGRAVRDRRGHRDPHVLRADRPVRHRNGLRHLQTRRSRRSWRRPAPSTSSTVSRRRCRTPTTTSWPTSRGTAATRWCRGCPAATSPPSS